MSTIYLVRHGRAAAGWGAHVDPGLDDLGQAQAAAMAQRLAATGPLPIVTSPLRRTRETAAPLERVWEASARIEPRVGEIPSPTADLAARAEWLRGVMQRRWPELDLSLQRWREQVIEALRDIRQDTVVVSHFIAINVAVGRATGDDRVITFRPDHCSCTIIEVAGDALQLVERGAEGQTRVL